MSQNAPVVNTLSNAVGVRNTNPQRRRRNRKHKKKESGQMADQQGQLVKSQAGSRGGKPRYSGSSGRKHAQVTGSGVFAGGNSGMQRPNLWLDRRLTDMSKMHYPPLALKALKSLMSPAQWLERLPGNETYPTALIKTIKEITIPVNFDNTPDSGRFSIVVSPTIGINGTKPQQWKLSVVNPTSGPGGTWPIDMTSPNSFFKFGGVNSDVNYQIDEEFQVLTQPQTANLYWTFNDANSSNPFNGGVNVQYFDSGIEPVFDEVGAPPVGRLFLRPGTYWIYLGAFGPGGVPPQQVLFTTGGLNGSSAVAVEVTYQNFTSGAQPFTIQYVQAYFYNPGDWIGFQSTYGAPYTQECELQISTAWFPTFNVVMPMNGGILDLMRPVATSILVSNEMAEMYTGGTIAGNLFDAPSLAKKYFVNSGDERLTNWETLIKQNGRPCYSGNVGEGTYGFWLPLNIDQTNLYRPDVALQDIPYGQLCVSGQYTNAANLTGLQIALRVMIVSGTEYTSTSLIPNVVYPEGSLQILDKVINAFNKSPTFCANGKHINAISKMAGFFGKALSDVNGLVQTGKAIGGAFGLL